MRNQPRRLQPDTFAAILIGIAPLLYFLPATLGQIVLAAADAVVFSMPLRIFTADMISAGHLPLWNPYIFCGMPLFASAQGGTLFPLNWGFLFGSPNWAMNFAVLGSYAAAGVGAFFYSRRSGATLLGAAVTALVWQFCGANVGQVTHTNILHAYAILPWLFWSIDGYIVRPGAGRGTLIATCVALQVFAGHQQTLAYALLLAGLYVLVRANGSGGKRWRLAAMSIAFLAVGLCAGAVQILPTAELLQASLREKATYEFFSSYSLPPVFLLTWFAPYVLGGGDGTLFRAPYISEPFYPEYIGYIGTAPLILALSASLLRRDRITIFWITAAVVCLALAMGRFLPLDLYRLVYYVPVLNLFRVPARHLMEVDFALAVLAGRAVTFLPELLERRRLRTLLSVGAAVLVLTLAAVTWLRPEDFRLARVAPVSVLRAPELFMPLVLAGVSFWVLLQFARARRFSGITLIVVIVADLSMWGQFSGWRVESFRPEKNLFAAPQFVEELRVQSQTQERFRVLTVDRPLADALANLPPTPGIDIHLQPDTYMVHQLENAAGYDGFGLKRYSRLAGDMKVWGEFPDPKRTLLASPELDLINVRYLVTAAAIAGVPPALPAKTKLGEFLFAESDLGLPYLERGMRLDFDTPPLSTTRIALVTNLAWSTELQDGTPVGKVTLRAQDGRSFSSDLRAGIDTAEWAHDKPALRDVIRHSRAPIASSSPVVDAAGNFDAHSFVTSFVLPESVTIVGGAIEAALLEHAPQLGVSVQRVSFVDESASRSIPLRREWIRSSRAEEAAQIAARWGEGRRVGDIVLYQNARALPRVWLAADAKTLPDEQKLAVIRSGKFADGTAWDPQRTVLVDESAPLREAAAASASGEARIVRYEPNEVEIAARARTPAILVLADNHYPGWRVTVDGAPADLLRVNYNLRGVHLGPGEHVVRFSYKPASVMFGGAISAVTTALLAAWCWRRRR